MADSDDEDGGALDLGTWSATATGSSAVDRELDRERVRAALFQRAAPRIGRYQIGAQLGAGASAVVYAAHDLQLDRPVAIKIFVARSSATQLHVLREARALAQLSHPNVVAVYEVGEWNDHAFIAMELIRGTTLARWQDAKRSTHELLTAYLQAGRGLEAAHRAGLVHRDFKPANVMVADGGRVAVTDFGLVSQVASDDPGDPGGSAADTHARVGTPAYVAPEQLRGTAPHPSADIYSFALALGWALTCRHPIEAEPAWRRAIARKVPRRLRAAIQAGLAADPAARGSSITPLLAAVAAALPRKARRDAATPPWLDGLAPASPRRWAARAALAATGLATALAGARALVEHRASDRPQELADGSPDWTRSILTLPGLRARIQAALDMVDGPPYEGTRAATELRSLFLHALPTAQRCAWPTSGPIQALVLGDGFVAVKDERGRVLVCTLADRTVSIIAQDARCVVRSGPREIGILEPTGDLRLHSGEHGRWQPAGVARLSGPLPPSWGNPLCPAVLVPDARGVVQMPSPAHMDRAGRFFLQQKRGVPERHIVDATRGSVLASLALSATPWVNGLDVSRDGASAVLIRGAGPLHEWSADATGGTWRTEPVHLQGDFARTVDLAPLGRRVLLTTSAGSVEVRTFGGGASWWLTRGSITDATFLGDDTVVGLDAEGQLWRWHLQDLRSGLVAIYRQPVWSLAVNAEVVVSGSEDGTATVVDRRTGALRRRVATGDQIYKVALDGDHLVIAGNGGLYAWNWRTGARLPMAPGGAVRIWDVEPAVAAGGQRIYIGGAIRSGDVWLWSSKGRTSLGQVSTRNVHGIAITHDGQTAIATSSQGQITLYDVPGQRVRAIGSVPRYHNPSHVVYDAATHAFVTAGWDGYLIAWSARDASIVQEVRLRGGVSHAVDVHAGRAIVSSGNSLSLVDLRSGEILRDYHGHHSVLQVARFRADGQWFVTGDEDGKVCLWRVDASECHTWLEGHNEGVNAIAFAEDGTIYTAAHDGTVRSWRPTYDQPISELYAALARLGIR